MSGGRAAHPFMGLAPDEPDQVPRLLEFRAAHPGVIIGDGGFGTFQGRVPEPNGETVITRYSLRELLDKLEIITGSPPGAGARPPGGNRPAGARRPAVVTA